MPAGAACREHGQRARLALQATDLCIGYAGGPDVVRHVDLAVGAGEALAVVGTSGSGKSTLLYGLAGVLPARLGTVRLAGQALTTASERQRSELRRSHVGLVLQFGELVPELSLLENVALPLRLLGTARRPALAMAKELLDSLGVASVAHRRSGQVSGGQAQRAAIARAVIHRPAVVLADEPTGALDSDTADQVLDVLIDAVLTRGAAMVLVTHDRRVAERVGHTAHMLDGHLGPAGQLPSDAEDTDGRNHVERSDRLAPT